MVFDEGCDEKSNRYLSVCHVIKRVPVRMDTGILVGKESGDRVK